MIKHTVLLVVDIQKDFCLNGALAALDTESLITPLNEYIKELEQKGVSIIYTKDCHKTTHKSFINNGGKWVKHCIVGTKGAELHQDLYIPSVHILVNKGIDDNVDGYSAFDNTGLELFLRKYNFINIIVCGIATSFCVAQTAISSSLLGFNTTVIKNLTRDITSNPKEIDKTWTRLKQYNILLK